MKIVYFTTAQEEKDYRSFINVWKLPLNSSNQNFHNKLIRALAIKDKVEVISVRPFSRSKTRVSKLKAETKQDGNITWHYLKRSGGGINRTLSIIPQVKKILNAMDLEDTIFITDTINTSIVRAVTKIQGKYRRPVIGVCTDSPSNISGTRRSYSVYLLEHCSKFDGYLTLTKGLNTLFNPEGKPHYLFEGIVEDRECPKYGESKKPFFFFGGALMERYGVYDLIKAFKKLENNNVDLFIAGHHGDKDKLKEAIGDNQNIKFLGLLPVNKVLEYEQNAIASINPRPFSEDLDRFSIPSKTLEYMASGRPVISVKNTILMSIFPDEVIWVKSSHSKDLLEGMNKVLDLTEVERENIGEELKNRVLKLYSLKTIGEGVHSFLGQFIK